MHWLEIFGLCQLEESFPLAIKRLQGFFLCTAGGIFTRVLLFLVMRPLLPHVGGLSWRRYTRLHAVRCFFNRLQAYGVAFAQSNFPFSLFRLCKLAVTLLLDGVDPSPGSCLNKSPCWLLTFYGGKALAVDGWMTAPQRKGVRTLASGRSAGGISRFKGEDFQNSKGRGSKFKNYQKARSHTCLVCRLL